MPGSRIRVRSELLDTEKFSEDTANLYLRHTVEVDGHAKPAAVRKDHPLHILIRR